MVENHKTRIILSVVIFLNIICVLLVLNLLSSNFGIASSSLFHLIALLLLLGVTVLNLPLKLTVVTLMKKRPYPVKLILGLIVLIGAFLLFTFSQTQLLLLSSVPLLISGLDLSLWTMDRKRKELRFLAIASFGYAFVFLLVHTILPLWSIYQQGSLLVSHAIGVIAGAPLLLGPTASGQGIVLVSLVFMISIFILIPEKTKKDTARFAISIGGVLIVWFFYLIFLGYATYTSKSDTMLFHPWFYLLILIPLFGYLFKSRTLEIPQEIPPQRSALKKLFKNGAVWAALFLFLSSTLLTVFVNASAPLADHRKIVFYGDHMLGTWDVPEYGKYGKDAVGMFGLLPVYLTTLGYETELLVSNRTRFLDTVQPQDQNITRYLNISDYTTIVETNKITEDHLRDAAVFVVTNLNISFSREEQTIIWEYVHKGGSLLVLGDHTNVGGLQTPLNELLSPVGIRFRFDAALPLDDTFKWLTCTHLHHHPITAFLPGLDTLQYGVGASLDVSPSSLPIIIGTCALSDEGNETNEDIAFLGDYEYNKGEQLGDVILVAGSFYGEGKVLVFGDTSSFQNAALTFSIPFIQRTFSWLTSTQTSTIIALQIGVALFFLLSALVVYRLWKDTTFHFTVFPLLLCVSLLLTASLNPLLLRGTEDIPSDNIVCIDASHNERFTMESFTDESVNGLVVNLQRNNFLPVLLRDFSKEKISERGMLVFIAPTAPFTGDEVNFLEQYTANGGFIILATGYEDKGASTSLLKAFDVDIEQIPLGPVPYWESNTTLYQNEPRFVDSWPLSFTQNQTVSYYNFTWANRTYHLVVFIPHGAGGLLVIGDSQFLLDKNIESIYDYWPGNILFLKYLLDELKSMEET
jgi:hypothetical protein